MLSLNQYPLSLLIIALLALFLGAPQARAQNASINVIFDKPADITGITEYRIYTRKSGETYGATPSYVLPVASCPGAQCTVSITDKPAGLYFFKARSFDGNLESLDSNEATALAVPVEMQGRSLTQGAGVPIVAEVMTGASVVSSSTVTPNQQGLLVIPTGAAGPPLPFDLRLNAVSYLARRISGYNVSSPAKITLPGGDVDDNGQVNASDYAYLKSNWFQPLSGVEDVFRDGAVNSLDYGVIKSNWLATDDN